MGKKAIILFLILVHFSCSKSESEDKSESSDSDSKVSEVGAAKAVEAAVADDRQTAAELSLILAADITASLRKEASSLRLMAVELPEGFEKDLALSIELDIKEYSADPKLLDYAIAAGAKYTFEAFDDVDGDDAILIAKALSDGVVSASAKIPTMLPAFRKASSSALESSVADVGVEFSLSDAVAATVEAALPLATEFLMKSGAIEPDATPEEMAEVFEKVQPDPELVAELSEAVAEKFEEVMDEIAEANPEVEAVLNDLKKNVVVDKQNVVVKMKQQIAGAMQAQAFLIADAALRVVEPPVEPKTPEILVFPPPPKPEEILLTAAQANQIARSLLQGMMLSGIRSSLDADLDGSRDPEAVEQVLAALPGFLSLRISMWFSEDYKNLNLRTMASLGEQLLDLVEGVFLAARDVYPDLFEEVTKEEKGRMSKLALISDYEKSPSFNSFKSYIGTALYHLSAQIVKNREQILAVDTRTRPTLVDLKLDGESVKRDEEIQYLEKILEYLGATFLNSMATMMPTEMSGRIFAANAMATDITVSRRKGLQGMSAIVAATAADDAISMNLQTTLDDFIFGFKIVHGEIVEVIDTTEHDFADFQEECSALHSLSIKNYSAQNLLFGLDHKDIGAWDIGGDVSMYSEILKKLGIEEITKGHEFDLLLCYLQAALFTIPDSILLHIPDDSLGKDNVDILVEIYKSRLYAILTDELLVDGSSSFDERHVTILDEFETEVNSMVSHFNDLNAQEKKLKAFEDEITEYLVEKSVTYSVEFKPLEGLGESL